MATAIVSAVQPTAETVPFTDDEQKYNARVDAFCANLLLISGDVVEMKTRQLPGVARGEKIYGKQSANRSQINALASHIKKVGDHIVPKLRKGGAKKSKGGFIGFAVPSFISRDMAAALGLQEGKSPLWPMGGKPAFSSSLMTKFFAHFVMVHGLIHEGDLAKFRCSETMRKLFTPFVVSSAKPGQPPLNLDALTYTSIQQLTKNFVEKRGKGTPGPHLNPEEGTEEQKAYARNLLAVFKLLEQQFSELGKAKDAVEDIMKKEAKIKADVVKAKAHLDHKQITPELYNDFATEYYEITKRKEALYTQYQQMAHAAGI